MLHQVSAVVKPHRVEDVKEALLDLGINGITASEVRGFGRQGGHTETYRGAEYTIDLLPKVKLDVVVSDEQLEPAIAAITEAARTGVIGDGKIWVTDTEGITRIRTGEQGPEAL
ncbi:P-II family nitrogen regulator [Aquihabitans sp. G128]|uniref:P-II family nitrogen regulator n=1 Tax=Aquihabitans sp. G128 TaxID=2849779 RepID=UPI001C238476|nr:P-II family nitrogen regulator [Aquihabitans sp. G128]QXC62999.1 P-II family nitrogen regulator [Aquihabitans sp. G128]